MSSEDSSASHSLSLSKPIIAALLCLVAAQFFMVLRFEANWDEYLLLDWVYDWRDGKVSLPLQTIYLRAFNWLPDLAGDELTRITAARFVMFGCFLATSFFLYQIAQRFMTVEAALFAVLSYNCFSFVFRHATSFRMDTIVTCVLMAALYCATRTRFTYISAIVVGLLLGLAGMITIKAIFYVPIVATILIVMWKNSGWGKDIFMKGAVAGCTAIVSFGLLYWFHSASLSSGIEGTEYIASVAAGSLFEKGFFPQSYFFAISFIQNPLFWVLMGLGALVIFKQHTATQSRSISAWVLLSFALPLLTLVFYLHAFPYYYVFLLAPASVLVGLGYQYFSVFKGVDRRGIILIVTIVLCASTLWRSANQNSDYQKQILTVVHDIFPDPVPFIDRSGMIASFEQTGFFMGNWQMEEYYDAGTPVFKSTIEEKQPVFVLANVESLNLDRLGIDPVEKRLLPQDEATLKSNYIHHWGPIYLAGKKAKLENGSANIEIAIPGIYTLKAEGTVTIDGKRVEPGDVIELTKGQHIVASTNTDSFQLKWGRNLSVPAEEPIADELFRGF